MPCLALPCLALPCLALPYYTMLCPALHKFVWRLLMPCHYYLLTRYHIFILLLFSGFICIKAHTTSFFLSFFFDLHFLLFLVAPDHYRSLLPSLITHLTPLRTHLLPLLPSLITHLYPLRTHLLSLVLGRHHVISVMFALLDDHPDAIMMWKDTKYLPNECILKCKHYFSGTYVYVRVLERIKTVMRLMYMDECKFDKFPVCMYSVIYLK